MRKAQREERQRTHHQRPTAVVDPGLTVAAVGHPEQGGEDQSALWNIEPEDPPPAQNLHDGAAVDRAQHRTGLGGCANNSQRQGPSFFRHQRRGQGHAYGNGCAATHRLHHPGSHHPPQAAGDGHQPCPNAEDYQRNRIDPGIPVYVAQTPDKGHGHGVAQEIGRHHPGHPVKLGDGDLEVQHHGGQGGYHHRLVQGCDERAETNDGEDGSRGQRP